MKTREELIDELIDLAFAEDIGDGDATTLCCIPADEMGRQRLIVKEEGILAGVEIARRVFEKFDPELQMEVMIEPMSNPVTSLLWCLARYAPCCRLSV